MQYYEDLKARPILPLGALACRDESGDDQVEGEDNKKTKDIDMHISALVQHMIEEIKMATADLYGLNLTTQAVLGTFVNVQSKTGASAWTLAPGLARYSRARVRPNLYWHVSGLSTSVFLPC